MSITHGMTKISVPLPKEDVCIMSKHTPIVSYKIMNLSDDGKSYQTLFHGVNGTRTIPFDIWIAAVRKWAGEGGQKYWTGFHVLLSREDCEKYAGRFTDEKKVRVIVKCYAKNLRPKESSRGKVFLAEQLMIPSKQ